MNRVSLKRWGWPIILLGLLLCPVQVQAAIDGITGTVFNLTAKAGTISAGDGQSIYIWGFQNDDAAAPVVQYPGPTLIVAQSSSTPITINLHNLLSVPVSIIFPGQQNVTATGGQAGIVTREAPPGGNVSYSFYPSRPGTFMYQSGTRPELQIEMGLVGALIVRPTGFHPTNNKIVYSGIEYDYEYLLFHTEMDYRIHQLVATGKMNQVDNAAWFPFYWFYNGRNAPDAMSDPNVPWLPNQPYSSMLRMHPGDRMLLRLVGAGRQAHPFHHHGNNGSIIARDGWVLSSDPLAATPAPDLAVSHFTETVTPGQTLDVIYDQWTGRQVGWDIYGHAITDDPIVSPASASEIYAQSTTAGALLVTDSSVTITAPTGQFPAGHSFRAIIYPQGSSIQAGPREVVELKRLQSSIDTFSMTRAREGTNAQPWPAGSAIVATDHGAPFPVILPDQKDLTFGQFWSGSPFLGAMGSLPPGQGGYNVNGGMSYMVHSHNEREMTNNNIWPGGMMTMLMIEPLGVMIPDSPF